MCSIIIKFKWKMKYWGILTELDKDYDACSNVGSV